LQTFNGCTGFPFPRITIFCFYFCFTTVHFHRRFYTCRWSRIVSFVLLLLRFFGLGSFSFMALSLFSFLCWVLVTLIRNEVCTHVTIFLVRCWTASYNAYSWSQESPRPTMSLNLLWIHSLVILLLSWLSGITTYLTEWWLVMSLTHIWYPKAASSLEFPVWKWPLAHLTYNVVKLTLVSIPSWLSGTTGCVSTPSFHLFLWSGRLCRERWRLN
jgi:hypothetical protein